MTEANEFKPDALARSLSSRVKLLEEEIDRLSVDKEINKDLIDSREQELIEIRRKSDELKRHIEIAYEQLDDFSCPICGDPMESKQFVSESIENGGRDFDIDHEYISYECGYTVVDDEVQHKCGNQK